MTTKSVEPAATPPPGTSRRDFLKGMGLVVGAATIAPATSTLAQPAEEVAASEGFRVLGSGVQSVTLTVNGEAKAVRVEPRTTLLDALREQAGLTGAKEVCDRGTCGCCTVLVDGKSVCSCLMLAVDAEGREVTTVEGIAKDPKYKNLIDAFCEHDAAQCGFCIPGFVVRSAELLAAVPNPTPDQVRHGLSGNICRCGTYTKMFDAVAAAAAKGGVA
jgi:aerobic-type carbon monoxide dehydrogenase small subunit (CoxS/CutS family)